MDRTYLRNLFFSFHNKLMLTMDGLTSYMMECAPILPSGVTTPVFAYNAHPKTYMEKTVDAFKELKSELKDAKLVMDFTSDEIEEGSVAYHRVYGIVTYDSRWYFSTKQFVKDLQMADENPAIGCHLLHINSPGGEAYYLDRTSEVLRSLNKPVVVLVEKVCASAAYYIGCHGSKIYAQTQNDTIGCIGVMVHVTTIAGFMEKLGIKDFDVKSSLSPLKNKMFDDLENGKPDEYRERVLDPLCRQFIDEVRSSRKQLHEVSDDSPVFQGDTFDGVHSVENGLIDGVLTFQEVSALAADVASKSIKIKKYAFNNL